ncbi:hypothetical protein ACHAWF_002311 [Thalassiosira exigua]
MFEVNGSDDNSAGKKTGNKTKVMMSDITWQGSSQRTIRWFYLDHYASVRETCIEELRALVEEKNELEGP